eukprot:scaffold1365_cov163-Ochromonas_danica.AAC.20
MKNALQKFACPLKSIRLLAVLCQAASIASALLSVSKRAQDVVTIKSTTCFNHPLGPYAWMVLHFCWPLSLDWWKADDSSQTGSFVARSCQPLPVQHQKRKGIVIRVENANEQKNG